MWSKKKRCGSAGEVAGRLKTSIITFGRKKPVEQSSWGWVEMRGIEEVLTRKEGEGVDVEMIESKKENYANANARDSPPSSS